MPSSTSRLSYTDCFDFMDQALADSKGLRVRLASEGDARQFRLRLHSARALDRRENAQTYPEDHPLFGRSIYDELILKMAGEYIFITKSNAQGLEVTPISELEEEDGEHESVDGDNGDLEAEGEAQYAADEEELRGER